jgi:hypothetical protein
MKKSMNIQANGVTVTTVASTSANGTIPVDSVGNRPRFVRVVSTGPAYVRLTIGAQTATTNACLVTSGAPVILEVGGCTHYALIDDGAIVKVNISPLEDN